MNEIQLRTKIANWPVQFIGIAEGSAEHLSILNVLNNSGLCSRYKMTKKDAWCATTVSAAFIANGMAGLPGSGKLFESVECSCGNMVNLAKKQGIWVENDNYTPKIGDVIMYDWDDSGSGDNTGWPDHVGFVISVSGKTFKVIEGNVRNTVGYRTMTVGGKFIRGFIVPKYDKFTTSAVSENTTTSTKPNTTSTPTKQPASASLNKTCKFKGSVTAKKLNIRTGAGTENGIARTITKDTIVEVCDTVKDKSGDDWYYIKYTGKYGFVSADYIARTSVPTTTTSATSLNKTCKFKGTVIAGSGLRVRSWAGTENDTLRTIAKNKVVEVCDEVKASTGKTWYYIKESGKYGFFEFF